MFQQAFYFLLPLKVAFERWPSPATMSISPRPPTTTTSACTRPEPADCYTLSPVRSTHNQRDMSSHCRCLQGHTHSSDCLQFSSDNQLIASGGWDCRTILWNVLVSESVDTACCLTFGCRWIDGRANLRLSASYQCDSIDLVSSRTELNGERMSRRYVMWQKPLRLLIFVMV